MNKNKFIVGKEYPFIYIKKIELDEKYFVFKDIYGERYLLPSYYYENYNFKPEQVVLCRILRVDCSGKVSIEPEHPYYKVGNVYDFIFKESTVIHEENTHKFTAENKKVKKSYLIVIDRYGNEHLAKTNKKIKDKSFGYKEVQCLLKSIAKGNFELEHIENKKNNFFYNFIAKAFKYRVVFMFVLKLF